MDHPNPMHRVGEQTERAGEAPLPAPRAAARPRSIKALRLGDSARMVDQSQSSAAPPDDTARKRRFQEWPGRNHFLCGGRVLLGVHVGRLRTTFALLSLTWAMHAFLHARDVNALCLAALALALAEYVSLASAAASDPGIIPRWPAEPQLERLTPHEKLSLRYCTTCHLPRPARAKHCRYCDNCVDRFDHHCPWTGNCVGLRNYRSFLSFVAATCAGTALIAAGAIGYLRDHRKRRDADAKKQAARGRPPTQPSAQDRAIAKARFKAKLGANPISAKVLAAQRKQDRKDARAREEARLAKEERDRRIANGEPAEDASEPTNYLDDESEPDSDLDAG